jgi:hypothetical protein
MGNEVAEPEEVTSCEESEAILSELHKQRDRDA